jgi:uridine kinase
MNAQLMAVIVDQCLSANSLFIVGIDGCGGAGKSRLATEVRLALASRGRDISVVHMDDFYLPSGLRNGTLACDAIGGAFDWQRLRDEVFTPLTTGQPGRYQRYDWPSDTLAEWHDVPNGIVVVEGVYSTRVDLEQFYDFTVWVECPRPIRLARGIERDGEAARRKWEEEWMPAEDQYVNEQAPHTRADMVYAESVVTPTV